jgi:hypothetical protein
MVSPQPSSTVPHSFAPQLRGVHTHRCVVVLQLPTLQPPQLIVPPQLSLTDPHSSVPQLAVVRGVQHALLWQT